MKRAQQAVTGRVRGDLPDAPPRPELSRVKAWFDVRPETRARIRTTRAAAEVVHGGPLDDDAFLEVILRSYEEQCGQKDATNTRPAYQVAITTCGTCKRSTQNSRGVEVDLSPAARDRALCDAELIGDPHESGAPGARVTSTVTPRKRRQIFARDGHRCVVPGCRATRNLDIHHVRPQALGGNQHAANLCTLCGVHHDASHHGIVTITGSAPDLVFKFLNDECECDLGGPCTCESSPARPPGDASDRP